MSDKDKLIKLLTEFGVGFDLEDGNTIQCNQGEDKINGYTFFFTQFIFDENDKFESMGAWE